MNSGVNGKSRAKMLARTPSTRGTGSPPDKRDVSGVGAAWVGSNHTEQALCLIGHHDGTIGQHGKRTRQAQGGRAPGAIHVPILPGAGYCLQRAIGSEPDYLIPARIRDEDLAVIRHGQPRWPGQHPPRKRGARSGRAW